MAAKNDSDKLTKSDYLDLARITQDDFASRRTLEWRLSLGLWGSIVVFVYTVAQDNTLGGIVRKELNDHSWIFFAVGIVHAFIIFLVQDSHARDRKLYWYYREKVELWDETGKTVNRPWPILTGEESCEEKANVKVLERGQKRKDTRRWLWFAYHSSITVFVLLAAWVILTSGTP